MFLNEGSTLFRGKKPTNLFYAVHTLLMSDEPVRSKVILPIVGSWHNLVPLMSKKTPEGVHYFRNEYRNGGSYWYLTEEGYNQYVKETGKHPSKPAYLNTEEVHYVDYDMEDESMTLDIAQELLLSEGYKIIKEDTEDIGMNLQDKIDNAKNFNLGARMLNTYIKRYSYNLPFDDHSYDIVDLVEENKDKVLKKLQKMNKEEIKSFLRQIFYEIPTEAYSYDSALNKILKVINKRD